MITWLLDCLITLLLDYFIAWLLDYLITWLFDYLFTWLLAYLIAWLLDYLITDLITWLLDYLITWLLDSLITWLLDYLITWLLEEVTQIKPRAYCIAILCGSWVLLYLNLRMVSIHVLLVNILKLSTIKIIIFVFQLINFDYRLYFHRNNIRYFWYSHTIRMSAYISS